MRRKMILTDAEAEAILAAAGRGQDEWEAEAEDDFTDSARMIPALISARRAIANGERVR